MKQGASDRIAPEIDRRSRTRRKERAGPTPQALGEENTIRAALDEDALRKALAS